MSAAQGPPCERCNRRVSKSFITRCPFCRLVLCTKCTCPNRCAEWAMRATAGRFDHSKGKP